MKNKIVMLNIHSLNENHFLVFKKFLQQNIYTQAHVHTRRNNLSDGLRLRSKQVRTPVAILHSLLDKY